MTELYFFMRKRKAVGGMSQVNTLLFFLAGALHIVVPIPEPEEREKARIKSRIQELTHYASAGVCVAGLGYGFLQPYSTRPGLKLMYFSSVVTLLLSLYSIGLAGEDQGHGLDVDDKTYLPRLAFMVSEYCTFISAALACAYPRVTKVTK